MITQILNPIKDNCACQKAAQLLKQGEVVAIPTETVYGLSANALDPFAVKKIFKAKGRPQDNPLIIHIAHANQMYELAKDIPQSAKELINVFWPAPLTIILKKSDIIPDDVSAGLDSVGIRLPKNEIAREIIQNCGFPLAAPSANTSGKPSPTKAKHVIDDLNGKIAAVVDGGSCCIGVESTVISFIEQKPRLLRPGGITLEQIESVIGNVEIDKAINSKINNNEKVRAPGMKYRHYAPRASVIVVCGRPEKTAEYIKQNAKENSGIICFDEYEHFFKTYEFRKIGSKDNISEQAKNIFEVLRQFDETNVCEIFAQCPSEDGLGLAVSNRLKKASGFNFITV